MRSLLLSLYRFPLPEQSWSGESARLRELWLQYVGNTGSGGDREDWTEQAARLDAALVADEVWISTDDITATSTRTGAVRPVGELAALPRWGADSRYSTLPPLPSDRAADRYWEGEAFARLAGRRVELAQHGDEPSTLLAALASLRNAGERRAVVKVTRPKYTIETVELHDEPRAQFRALADTLGYALIHLEGVPNAYLVQQHVEMRYEHRSFVVDGCVVTSAGCIESLTPAEATGDHDDRLVEHRWSSDPIREQPEVAAELRAFAQRAADALRAERPEMTEYTLDSALGPDGPLLVECNALRNSGLYATQPRRVVEALLHR